MTKHLLLAMLSVCWATWSAAQEAAPPAEDPAHNEIRAVRDGFLDAFEKKDIERMLSYLSENVVITVQNAEVLRGHDAVRGFHNRMSEGDERLVQELKTQFEVDELSILYGGDTAIAFGNMNDQFKLKRGMQFDLHSRWSATLVKPDNRWQVAAFHVSTNMFDNGVGNLLIKWAAIKAGAIALLGGLLGGVLGAGWWNRRNRPSAAATP
jgi:ketosteroid isomerase-like protein